MVVLKPNMGFEHDNMGNHDVLHSLFNWPEVNNKQTLGKISLYSNGKKVKIFCRILRI